MTTVTTRRRRSVGKAIASVVIVAVIALAAFALLRDSPQPTAVVGHVVDFPPGSVTDTGYAVRLGEPAADLPAGWAAPAYDAERRLERTRRPSLYLVNDRSAGLLALWGRDPHLGCLVVALPLTEAPGPMEVHRDTVFANPCHGEQYALDGRWLGGPSPRGLDRFAVSVDADGNVVVDARRYQPGPDR